MALNIIFFEMNIFRIEHEQLKILKFPFRFEVLGVSLLYLLLGQKQLSCKQLCSLAI